MTVESLAMYVSGPASAVIVMLLFFYALYQLTSKQLIPMAGRGLDRHLQALDALVTSQKELVTSQREDHARMLASLDKIEEHCRGRSALTQPNGLQS